MKIGVENNGIFSSLSSSFIQINTRLLIVALGGRTKREGDEKTKEKKNEKRKMENEKTIAPTD